LGNIGWRKSIDAAAFFSLALVKVGRTKTGRAQKKTYIEE